MTGCINCRYKFLFIFFFINAISIGFLISCSIVCTFLQQMKNERFFYTSLIERDNFHRDLSTLHDWRINWRKMLKPCEGKLSWYKRNVFSELRTDAEQSYLMKIDLNNSGRFSRLWIQSVDTKGNPKSVGGDSWRVYVRNGPTSIAPIILDKNNGVYEVMMLIMEPGIYQANIFLDYSLCDGLREPPDFWFINGTDHGTYHHPQEGVLGNIERDYIQSCLGGQTKYEFEIKPNLGNTLDGISFSNLGKAKCRLIWDGHGYWKNTRWFSYQNQSDSLVDNDYVKSHRSGTLWVYGDSLGMRFIDSAQSRPLCTKIFSICESTYNWIYEVKEKRNPLKIQTKFNKTIILNKIQNILQRQDMNQPSSVFMFSFGVHFPISLRLEEFKDLIDSVILLVSKRINGTKIFKGIPIWKTTAAFEKEKINRTPWPNKPHNFTMFRFLTTQRNQLFHSYAMSAMCKAGIPVLDVYPLTAAYREGTLDYVHYNNTVFYPAEAALERYIIANRQKLDERRKILG